MKPERIQRKRSKGWRIPPNTVCVTRPGKWGNPWKVGQWSSTLQRIMDRGDAVARFETEITTGLSQHIALAARRELRGKNLACFCPLDKPCHADVLLRIANAPEAK